MNLALIILIVLTIILLVATYKLVYSRSESFVLGCNSMNKIFNADYYTKEYPYYGNDFYKPLDISQTDLEKTDPTLLYESLY